MGTGSGIGACGCCRAVGISSTAPDPGPWLPGISGGAGIPPCCASAVQTIRSATDATINATAIDLSALCLIVFTKLNPKH
jgi:hypothetical protein